MSDQERAMHKHPLAHTFKVNVQLPPDSSKETLDRIEWTLQKMAEPLAALVVSNEHLQVEAAIAREEADDARQRAQKSWQDNHVNERISKYGDRAKAAEDELARYVDAFGPLPDEPQER